MDHTTKLCNSVKNSNVEEDEWELKIMKYGWSPKHNKLFNQVVKILDYDRLARLANVDNKRYEAVQRRVAIDKSADRMRKVLAEFAWDTQLVQWIHGLMMEYLPASYLAAYLDIMQTLKTKLPSLVDKMIFWKSGNVNQELLAPILKRPWQPALNNKYRKLPGNALLVVIPSAAPRLTPQSSRIQKLYTLFTTMAPMLPIQLSINSVAAQNQSLQSIAEQTVSIARTKIQELKAENPDRRLILIGLNSASALAMQVALVEQVSGVVCFGFSVNTVHGVRGQADDHFLELSAPLLFLVGQNAARSNEEEIEHFREKLTAPTSTIVVGAADDYLRMSKTKRRLEGVTQEMVDNMVVDEIADFATKCLQRPLPAKPKSVVLASAPRREIDSSTGQPRKRKTSNNVDGDGIKSLTVKSQKLMRPTSTTSIPGASSSDDVLEMAVQSILDPEEKIPAQKIRSAPQKIYSANRIVSGTLGANQRIKVTNQFAAVKQQALQQQTKYITITGHKHQKNLQFVPLQSRPIVGSSSSRPTTPTQTQYVFSNRKAPPPTQQQSFSPTKYTIVRSSNSTPGVSYVTESAGSDLAGANIFDMPIVFADNEGNIDEDAAAMSDGSVISVASDSPPATVSKQVVLKTTPAYTVTKNKNILIQKPTAGKQVFMINGTVIGKQVSANNIVLPKSNLPQIKMQKFMQGARFVPTAPPGKRIEILNNTIIRPASANLPKVQSTSFVNLADPKQLTGARLSLPVGPNTVKNQIIIKTNALKPYTGAQILPSTIGSKQLGNLTVKRLNVAPSTIAKVFKKN